MTQKPQKLYHGTNKRISGALKPIFATERLDLAALFMFPFDHIASIGFEEDTAYICIWGTPEAFEEKDFGGFIYVLPSTTFEKIGKDYEYQSFEAVEPETTKVFESVIDGMMDCGVQVYFIDDEAVFDQIVADKKNRAPLLKTLVSENEKEED
ncbi:MAG: hypothetical protein AAB383_05650 [Patescibacteria group bacterium]